MKKYNVGVAGYGWAAGAHIDAINTGELGQVTAVCSSRKLDAAQVSAKHGSPMKVYQDYNAMLKDPDLHAVSVCSYHSQHPEQVILAARAGKHIIAEKPLALNLKDIHKIEKEVKAAGVKFCICFELRFSTQFRVIKSLIDRGLLGKLHYGEFDYYHGIGAWYREYEWCVTNKNCGSSLLAAGCHAMDALLGCMGDDVEEVVSYGCNSKSSIFDKYEYPSTSVTMLKFKSDKTAKCASVIDCLQPYYFHTHLVGSEGSLLDNKFHSNVLQGLDKNRWSQLSFSPVDSGDVADHPYKTQFNAFFNAISKNKPMPLTGLKEAVLTHEVIFAAEKSLSLKRPVKMEEVRS
jgi:predicted dehydrogenase